MKDESAELRVYMDEQLTAPTPLKPLRTLRSLNLGRKAVRTTINNLKLFQTISNNLKPFQTIINNLKQIRN